jgi:hypothetical protein
MRRIGRTPTPAERGLQLALECPDLLEELATNLFEAKSGLPPRAAHQRWAGLGDTARETWRDRVLGMLRSHARGADDR